MNYTIAFKTFSRISIIIFTVFDWLSVALFVSNSCDLLYERLLFPQKKGVIGDEEPRSLSQQTFRYLSENDKYFFVVEIVGNCVSFAPSIDFYNNSRRNIEISRETMISWILKGLLAWELNNAVMRSLRVLFKSVHICLFSLNQIDNFSPGHFWRSRDCIILSDFARIYVWISEAALVSILDLA